jgi:hypothetical protein
MNSFRCWPKLIVIGIVVALDGWTVKAALFSFGGPVRAFDLAVRRDNSPPDYCLILLTPWMVRLGQTMLDPVLCTDAVEQVACEPCC